MKFLITSMSSILLLTTQAQQKTISQTFHFNSNDTVALDNTVLQELKQELYGRKIKYTSIVGHTDNTANDAYNNTLGQYRANYIANNVLKNNTSFSFFNYEAIKSEGETKPIALNNTDANKALNRRVQFDVVVDYSTNFSNKHLNEYLKSDAERFCFNNKRDTILISKNGILLYLKALSFTTNTDCVKIEVREGNTITDILKNNLTTNNDSNVLHSHSMVEVNAFVNGIPAPLQNGLDYIVFMPTKTSAKGAALYKGEVNEDGNVNWKLVNNKSVDNRIMELKAEDFRRCSSVSRVGSCLVDRKCKKTHFFMYGFSNLLSSLFSKKAYVNWKHFRSCNANKKPKPIVSIVPQNSNLENIRAAQVNVARNECFSQTNGACSKVYGKYQLACEVNLNKAIDKAFENITKGENSLNIKNINELEFAIFSINDMGWSNIDWMYHLSTGFNSLYVKLDATKNTDAKIIFSQQKTILRAQKGNNDKLVFEKIPNQQNAYILLTDTRTEKGYILAQKIDLVTNGQTITPNFKIYTLVEYKSFIESLH